MKKVLRDDVVKLILESEDGWYLVGDNFDSIVEVRKDDKGFEVFSENQYVAWFDNEGIMRWFTRDILGRA